MLRKKARRAAEVPVRRRTVRDEPVHAIEVACAECGPWNVVALAEPFTSPACPSLGRLFEAVSGTTGLVVVGPEARRTAGPVVLAVEDIEHLSGMLRAAERLAAVDGGDILLVLIGEEKERLGWLEGETRLALGDRADVPLASTEVARGAAAAAEALRRLEPGFIIARFGGLVVPEEGDLKPLAAALECPLLLVR